MPTRFPFIVGPQDLVTTREARRDGFLEIALRRDSESTPFLTQGRALWTTLKTHAKTYTDVLGMSDIRPALLLAAGFSVKAQGNMTDDDKKKVLAEFCDRVLKPCSRQFVDEIVYRYLLALGEQLGGRMRNIIGDVARGKLTQGIVAQLRVKGRSFAIHGKDGAWVDGSQCTSVDVDSAKAVRWETDGYRRMLVHNVNIPRVSKNVDIVVLNEFAKDVKAKTLADLLGDNKKYVVMGELKGGIDPAGADEHWKTARTALDRIRSHFKKVYVAFVGAAIEKAMAEEIFNQLQNGTLDYAANMTNGNQLAAFCGWLVDQ